MGRRTGGKQDNPVTLHGRVGQYWTEEQESLQALSEVLEALKLGEIPVPKNALSDVDTVLVRGFNKP